jgi:hypothetical protein
VALEILSLLMVYDEAGNYVRKIASNMLVSVNTSLIWDGTADDGYTCEYRHIYHTDKPVQRYRKNRTLEKSLHGNKKIG